MPPPPLGDSCFQADASPGSGAVKEGGRPRFKFGMCTESCQRASEPTGPACWVFFRVAGAPDTGTGGAQMTGSGVGF